MRAVLGSTTHKGFLLANKALGGVQVDGHTPALERNILKLNYLIIYDNDTLKGFY